MKNKNSARLSDEEKIHQYEKICSFTNRQAKPCASRNFNYFIRNPLADNIAITYEFADKGQFWGLDTSINEQYIVQWLTCSDSPFSCADALNRKTEELIREKLWHFQMDLPDAQLLEAAMCKRVLLSFCMHFFMYYKCSYEIYDILKETWSDVENVPFDYIDINQQLRSYAEKHGELVKINGRLHDGVIGALEKRGIHYSIDRENEFPVIVLSESAEGKKPIAELYKNEDLKGVLQCVSPVFYSGDMARIKRVHEQYNYGNANVYGYLFELESISYATHLGLKDPRMGYSCCFFSPQEQEVLKRFDRWEVMLQEELISRIEAGASPVDAFNLYLSKSGYTHGMNTSSNIETSDGYLVYTKRGSKTFDSETLYCSANGVCEVFDDRVSFYHHSVECDLPTIAQSHWFGGFGGELTREAYAELGVFIEPTTWEYYGFSIMGYRSQNRAHRFPLHVNILAYSRSDRTLKQIRKSGTSAVEKEENENILGICVQTANNVYEAAVIKVRHFFRVLYEKKDMIADMLILFTVLSLFRNKVMSGSSVWQGFLFVVRDFSVVEWFSLLTALLTLCFVGVEIKNIILETIRKYKKVLFFVVSNKTDPDILIKKCLDSARKNAGCKKINPIFSLMFQLYFYRHQKSE